MKTVGIADLKARLSAHLRAVRKGRSVTVMERQTPVARLVPYVADPVEIRRATKQPRSVKQLPSGLVALAPRHPVTIGASGGSDLYPALPRERQRTRTATAMLQEERGER